MNIPNELLEFLSDYQIVAWGYKFTRHVESADRDRFRPYGRVDSVGAMEGFDRVLITKTLTRADAIAKYGKISKEVRGPRGGFKEATFGKKTFISKFLK